MEISQKARLQKVMRLFQVLLLFIFYLLKLFLKAQNKGKFLKLGSQPRKNHSKKYQSMYSHIPLQKRNSHSIILTNTLFAYTQRSRRYVFERQGKWTQVSKQGYYVLSPKADRPSLISVSNHIAFLTAAAGPEKRGSGKVVNGFAVPPLKIMYYRR